MHLAVVDPSRRRPAPVAVYAAALLVAPDNGCCGSSPAGRVSGGGPRAAPSRPTAERHLYGRTFWRPWARLARSTLEALGPGLPALEPLPDLELPARAGDVIHGRIVHIDRFGNLISNVPGAWLAPELRWTVSLGERLTATLQRTYCDVRPGVAIALIGGHGYVEIAINAGDAAQALGLGVGGASR